MYNLLFVVLIFLMIVIFLLDGDIISPAMIMCISWVICGFIASCFEKKWSMGITLQTIIVIVSALLAFIIGQLFSQTLYRKSHICEDRKNRNINISNKTNIFLQCFLCVIVGIIFIFEYKYAGRMGNTAGISLMLKYVRSSDESIYPSIMSPFIKLSDAIGIFYTYLLCRKKIEGEDYKKYICGVALHIIQGWLTAGRTWLIHLIVEIFIFSVIDYKAFYGWKKVKNIKLVIKCSAVFLIFLFLFPRLGVLIGKGKGTDPLEIIGYYAGSSIPLFSNWLNYNGISSSNDYFGEYTLHGIYNFLSIFGLVDAPVELNLEATYIPHFYSNIYTSLRRYIQDYGILGMLILQNLWGLLYGYMYEKIRVKKDNGFLLLLYGTIFYPVAESAIEERVLCKLFTMSTVFTCLCLWIIYRFFTNRKNTDFGYIINNIDY